MTQQGLEKLVKVELREVWSGEATEFTPWLAEKENLDLLGETLCIALELEAQEKDVGPYSADIFCKNTADDSWVVIENQLEKTNHSHLGQILTYAAGLSAVTVVWIAKRFTDEHRAALDWLNEISSDSAQFFGLEIEVWQIGESLPAPKFNIVAKPNEWTRGDRIRPQPLTPNQQLQLEFWQGFRNYLQDRETPIEPSKPQPRHYMDIGLGRSGFRYSAIASLYDSAVGGYSSQELRACLYIYDTKYAKSYFELLKHEKTQIEKEMNRDLVWYNPENAQACTIYVRKSTNLKDLSERPNQYAWLIENLEKIHQVFSGRVMNLEIPIEDFEGSSSSD